MDAAEVGENLFAAGDAKLHGGMCKQLSTIVCGILEIFPDLEAARPRSKSGIQALCSLHVALDKAKRLLQNCSECSKFYLAITGESVLMKFEKARCALQESLKRVEEVVPQAVACQIIEMVGELEGTVFALDQLEKQAGENVIALLQKERKFSCDSNNCIELEIFHQAALNLGITSSRAALTERRALKKLIERARAEEDTRKESIVAFLLHLMRKYSKLFRTDATDDADSQGSSPCSPTISCEASGQAFERQLTKLSSFNFKQNVAKSGSMQSLPEEFRCPISLQLMYDPVIISSGQTYERVCIEKWFKDGHNTCPKTQQKLPHLGITPNYCVKGLIASWCEQSGNPIPDAPPESLDLNYWRLALSEREATDSGSVGSVNSCQLKEVKVVPFEEGEAFKEGDEMRHVDSRPCHDAEVDYYEKYESLLSILRDGRESWMKQCNVVEQIRLLLKDEEEVRIYMGANGFVEVLVRFLRSAVDGDDEKAQEIGAMALFNLAVNNNRNKAMLLSGGVIPLLERMITNPKTCESSAALYLNLSCSDDAKPIIASSDALPHLIRLLDPNNPQSISCKHDTLHCLFNISAHHPAIPSLLASDIIAHLNALLAASTWTEKVLAVLKNLASDPTARRKMAATPGLFTSFATVLDVGDSQEQEQVVACLLMLCSSDEKCSDLVLREGVIPALVSVSVNGTGRGKEKARKLLKLFREQRQREQSPVKERERVRSSESCDEVVTGRNGLRKSRSRRLGKTIGSFWKSGKSFSAPQC